MWKVSRVLSECVFSRKYIKEKGSDRLHVVYTWDDIEYFHFGLDSFSVCVNVILVHYNRAPAQVVTSSKHLQICSRGHLNASNTMPNPSSSDTNGFVLRRLTCPLKRIYLMIWTNDLLYTYHIMLKRKIPIVNA